ncbi:MAG: Glu-tRNA(Gln) amidotransferase subunit GatE [Methanocellales archaeon]|nr:Glu-tRNA(Gln) amidotransferase subunit GatE [Methanocellales archaeon]MDD3291380.1 Glu-tRNA(Gln) amidotransferase subunit GatE [Methanocellales archaeon]MDD5234730.1 Glu-tRNA(Gln) amidotransferase subunit GatE [Methanocellales archaeon]MDD5484919.1 Glu-tRNA(Gln) amidotransferase subunit GatE [Methanocellales archaeon]
MKSVDYEGLGLKAGLEIHQQLDTKRKLFCNCPTELRRASDSTYEIYRHLQVSESELGEIDRAALEEAQVNRRFIYKGYDTTCLVENDEEPPGPLNPDAIDIALEIALLLGMTPVDEIHTMRKIVIDGSNTSGFQRTAFVASDGKISLGDNIIHIDTVCLEEEAAQKISEDVDGVVYSLDRLGIPLVEITTSPEAKTPEQVCSLAKWIGMILRSTGKVKRGIGTIRQDINVSIAKGARIEIKGVQTLDMIETIVDREVIRQVNLLKVKDELRQRGAKKVREVLVDVSEVFDNPQGIGKSLKNNVVLAVKLPSFGGLAGREIQPDRRFFDELSDRLKRFSRGAFYTDELPNEIGADQIAGIRKKIGAGPEDCVVLVVDEESRARSALNAVIQRANEALEGIPEETRRALQNGNSAYMRPLPGAARMYPETDVLPVPISREMLKKINSPLPELICERQGRYLREYNLSDELAELIACSEQSALFERIMSLDAPPTLVARTLTATLSELRREGIPVQHLLDGHFIEIFEMIRANRMVKEGIPEVLRVLANTPSKTASIVSSELGLEMLDKGDIEKLIMQVIESKRDLIKERGTDAVKPLMGLIMERVRGKADGKLVSNLLKEKIKGFMEE